MTTVLFYRHFVHSTLRIEILKNIYTWVKPISAFFMDFFLFLYQRKQEQI